MLQFIHRKSKDKTLQFKQKRKEMVQWLSGCVRPFARPSSVVLALFRVRFVPVLAEKANASE